MLLPLQCVILALLSGCVIGQDTTYAVGTGTLIRGEGRRCSPVAWYRDADFKVIKVELGPHQVRIDEESTWEGITNVTAKAVTCKKDSDITFDAYRQSQRTKNRFDIGTVDFNKPVKFEGVYKAVLTTLPIVSGVAKLPAVSWSKDDKWAGYDWIKSLHGFSRVWWDELATDRPPDSNQLELQQCDAKLPGDYKLPTADCMGLFKAPEADYKMKDYPYQGSGRIYKPEPTDHTKRYSIPVKYLHNPGKKLFAIISGDLNAQTDTKKFSIGYWANATGTYLMFAGKNKCIWQSNWNYEKAVAGYSTPQLGWIGKAKLKEWFPKSAEGLEVNMYAGTYNLGPGFPMVALIDTNGVYRGEVTFRNMSQPPNRVFIDQSEATAPSTDQFEPPSKCEGFADFTSQKGGSVSGGETVTQLNLYSIPLLLMFVLFKQYV